MLLRGKQITGKAGNQKKRNAEGPEWHSILVLSPSEPFHMHNEAESDAGLTCTCPDDDCKPGMLVAQEVS